MAKEYYTVFSDHIDTLDQQVNERLAQGWELQGGISVCVRKAPITLDKLTGESRIDSNDDYWYTYLQAMVRN